MIPMCHIKDEEGCFTYDTCYNYSIHKYDNTKCQKETESCAMFYPPDESSELEGCILSSYCNT